MGDCLKKAAQLTGIIDGTNWEIFDAIGNLVDGRQAQATSIRASVLQALAADEHVTALGPALKEAQLKAVRLLTTTPKGPDPGPGPGSVPVPTPVPTPVQVPPVTKPPQSQRRVITTQSRQNLTLADAKTLLEKLDQELQPGEDLMLNLSWIVEAGGGTP